jgi:hypothetical protein
VNHWPDIFLEVLNSDPSFNQLTGEERHFQQGNASTLTAEKSMAIMHEVFQKRILNRGL